MWGEKGVEGDIVDTKSLEDARVAFIDCFPGELGDLSVFSRCLDEAEVQKLCQEQQDSATKLPLSAPVAPALEKVEIDGSSPLTWKEHEQRAADLGGRLPSRIDLI